MAEKKKQIVGLSKDLFKTVNRNWIQFYLILQKETPSKVKDYFLTKDRETERTVHE